VTLREAVQILNDRKHCGLSDWVVSAFPGETGPHQIGSRSRDYRFSEFETFAIAEKYARQPESVYPGTHREGADAAEAD
jgi:hypothetical protein